MNFWDRWQIAVILRLRIFSLYLRDCHKSKSSMLLQVSYIDLR